MPKAAKVFQRSLQLNPHIEEFQKSLTPENESAPRNLYALGATYLEPVHKSDGRFGVLRFAAALHSSAAFDWDSKALTWNEKRRQVARTP